MEIGIENRNGRAHVLLDGRFDVKCNLSFRNAVKSVMEDPAVATVFVDFAKVSFIDSSALGQLLLLRAQAQEAKKSVVLGNCGADLRRVLEVAQFHRMFAIE